MAFDWNDRTIGHLTEMWGKGLSAREIALRLGPGCSRNGVIGKAARIGLPGRESPIKRGENPNSVGARRRTEKTPEQIQQSRLASLAKARLRLAELRVEREPLLPLGIKARVPVDVPEPESRRKPFSDLERKECHWFTGPITRGYADRAECCAHPVADGRPYCAFHANRAADKRKTEESQERAA